MVTVYTIAPYCETLDGEETLGTDEGDHFLSCKALRNVLDELAKVGVPQHSSLEIPGGRQPPRLAFLRWLSHSDIYERVGFRREETVLLSHIWGAI